MICDRGLITRDIIDKMDVLDDVGVHEALLMDDQGVLLVVSMNRADQ